jgi:hypothetical protein
LLDFSEIAIVLVTVKDGTHILYFKNLTDATERRQVMMLAIDMCSIASCAENLAHLCYTVADRHVLNKLNAARRDTAYTATAAKVC